jgi:hypothetical protein
MYLLENNIINEKFCHIQSSIFSKIINNSMKQMLIIND